MLSLLVDEVTMLSVYDFSLTRYCRSRFEREDLEEAKVLCGSTSNDSPEYTQELSSSRVGENLDGVSAEEHDEHHIRSRFGYLTWKLSNTIGFSYSATLPRKRQNNHRQPIPFGPRSSAESGAPLRPSSSRLELLQKSTSDAERPALSHPQETIHEGASEDAHEEPIYDHHDAHALVSPHSRHPVWDDEPNPDTPYDNPYYTRPISDTLWLPRDPMDILNLDDTVDLRISITSEPGAGRLELWAEDEFIGSALSSVFAPSFGTADDTSSIQHSIAQLDGSEDIKLPAGIASRVELFDRQHEVETSSHPVSRPALGRPRTSTSSVRRPVALRRATVSSEGPPRPTMRSFSQGSAPQSRTQRPDASYLSLPAPRSRHRGPSFSALGIGLPSTEPMQRVPTSAPSMRSRVTSINDPASPAVASIISTREAVVGEAIAEEQEVVEEISRQEEAEKEKAKSSRSWLTSWMYSTVR